MVPPALAGQRVDRVVAMITGLPRSEVSALVEAGAVVVDGRPVSSRSRKLDEGEVIEVALTPAESSAPVADSSIPLSVVFEDEWLAVVDKQAGLVVHPGAGNADHTLVNVILARWPGAAAAGDPSRPGIVHRLDKGTSGLMVIALQPASYESLVAMMAARDVARRYLALVQGEVEGTRGVVDAPVGRSARQPTRMAVSAAGREARTRYEVLERLAGPTTLVECSLETGRTHQIRVHMAAIGHPLVGDPRYGSRSIVSPVQHPRPFLHAHQLELRHPMTGEDHQWRSALPEDLGALLEELRLTGPPEPQPDPGGSSPQT